MSKRLFVSSLTFMVIVSLSVLIITRQAQADPPYSCEMEPYHVGYQQMHWCGIGCNLPLTCTCCNFCLDECIYICWVMYWGCDGGWRINPDVNDCQRGCRDAYRARGCGTLCGDPG